MMKKIFRSLFKGSSTNDKSAQTEEQNTELATKAASDRDNILRADTLKFDAIRAMKINEFDFAIEALLKSLELRPEFEARYYLADVYNRVGNTIAALEHMNLLLEEEPDHIPTLLNRAKLRLAQKEAQLALGDLEHAQTLASEDEEKALLYYVEAQCYEALDSNEKALEAVNKTLLIDGDLRMPALLLRTQLHYDGRRFDEAELDVQKGRADYPEEESFLIWQGKIFAQREGWEQAEQCFNQVLDLNPFSEEAHLSIAKMLIRKNEEQKAEAYLRESLEELPSSVALHLLLIELLKGSGRNAEAEELKAALAELGASDSLLDFSQLYAGGLY